MEPRARAGGALHSAGRPRVQGQHGAVEPERRGGSRAPRRARHLSLCAVPTAPTRGPRGSVVVDRPRRRVQPRDGAPASPPLRRAHEHHGDDRSRRVGTSPCVGPAWCRAPLRRRCRRRRAVGRGGASHLAAADGDRLLACRRESRAGQRSSARGHRPRPLLPRSLHASTWARASPPGDTKEPKMTRRFASPDAFKASIEARLNTEARRSGCSVRRALGREGGREGRASAALSEARRAPRRRRVG